MNVHVDLRRSGALAAMVAAIAAVLPATANAADWPRRLFTVVTSADPQEDPVHDFLERPGGALLVASGSEDSFRGRVRELTLAGRLRPVVEFRRGRGRSGIGLLADRRRSFLAISGWQARVQRVLASARTEVFAGNGRPGVGGDGGPAIAARLRFGASGLVGIARMADRSVAIVDPWNYRLRRVRPDGVIETIAGPGPRPPGTGCPAFSGDGGPATQATLCGPVDVLATADGALLVSDGGRVRRIAADGTITTIAGNGSGEDRTAADEGEPATDVPLFLPEGLAQTATGELLVAERDRISRITADGRIETVFHTSWAFTRDLAVEDFAGRGIGGPTGLVTTAEGGLLIAAVHAYYLAPRRTRRTLVGIRGADVGRGRLTLDVEASRRARATVRVRAGGRTIARSTRTVRGGKRTLTVSGAFAARQHDVLVTLSGRRRARAHDRLSLYLGTQLRGAYARRLAERVFAEEGVVRRCRRFTARRVDCVLINDGCQTVLSFTLRRTGVVWWRPYDCTDPEDAFREQPAYTGPDRPVPTIN